MVARGGEVALVGRDAEAVDLAVGVRDGARADAREGFPEAGGLVGGVKGVGRKVPDRVVVASCGG